jgi:hypothetical protein
MSFTANETAIRDLETEMDDIEDIIQDLRDKQRSLGTQRNSNLPFFCLPLEICIVIFSLACHKGRLPKQRENIPLVTTPFLISSICHGFCVMAHSAPELWCSVSLCVQPYIKGRSEIQAELLDQWLRLAKSLPLSIAMTFDPEEAAESESDPCLTALAAVTSVVTSRSHQWESLDLFLPLPWAKTFKSGMGHVPNLKSLDLNVDTYGCDSKLPFSTTFRDAPKLRTVTTGHENINVGLPYHQLEELTFWDYPHNPASEAFISRCTNLKSFRALSCWVPQHTYTSHMSVHLSKLVSLEIIAIAPQHLLGSLVAPSLVCITIPLKGPDEIEAFLAFLMRSDMTLKRLSIVDFVPREEKLLWKIFDALPNLSHLEIDEPLQKDLWSDSTHCWLPSQRFFDYFSTPNMTSGGLLLPHLTSFKYQGRLKFHTSMTRGNADSGNSVDVDTLEKMLLARWNIGLPFNSGASRLQAFSMSITDLPRSVTKMEESLVVKELRKEGMRLVFKFVEPRKHMKLGEFR